MNSRARNRKEETLSCCEGMPFADMMRKMMDQEKRRCGPDCAEMIGKMMTKCCGPTDAKEKTAREEKKRQTDSQ
jgi:hypothetical protein